MPLNFEDEDQVKSNSNNESPLRNLVFEVIKESEEQTSQSGEKDVHPSDHLQ